MEARRTVVASIINCKISALFVFQIFIAVIVHKGIMAFSLGLNLAQSQGMTVKYFVASVIVFSLASPVGMGIGMAISGKCQLENINALPPVL